MKPQQSSEQWAEPDTSLDQPYPPHPIYDELLADLLAWQDAEADSARADINTQMVTAMADVHTRAAAAQARTDEIADAARYGAPDGDGS